MTCSSLEEKAEILQRCRCLSNQQLMVTQDLESNVPMVKLNFSSNREFLKRNFNFLGGGVSMTDASGKPYVTASNGSMASMNTTSTTLGSTNDSTVASSITRSPLRSSLKKPKPKDGLGIQNPGFSGTSPTMSRNGSMKKVRIQTHSTEV